MPSIEFNSMFVRFSRAQKPLLRPLSDRPLLNTSNLLLKAYRLPL
jgi:hypothetical protein